MHGGAGGSSFSDFFDMLFGQSMAAGQGGGGFSGTRGRSTYAGARQNRVPAPHQAEIDLSLEEMARGTMRTLQISAPNGNSKTVDVKIPAGVHPGSKVRVAGKNAGSDGADIYLVVKAKPHPNFTLDGNNLLSELSITPAQAVLGTEATVQTLEGEKSVKVPAGSQAGRTLRLRGHGLPGFKGAPSGDQLVKLKVVIPSKPTPEQLKLYEELAKLESKS